MRRLGLQGAGRGKGVHTTVPDAKAACPLDRINRQFKARRPDQLWVADFTYVSTWQGLVYVAFVVDVFGDSYRAKEARERLAVPARQRSGKARSKA